MRGQQRAELRHMNKQERITRPLTRLPLSQALPEIQMVYPFENFFAPLLTVSLPWRTFFRSYTGTRGMLIKTQFSAVVGV